MSLNDKLQAGDYSGDEMADLLADEEANPLEKLVKKEQREAINKLLAELPEKQRILLQGRYLLGKSVKELAIELRISEGACSCALFRAKARLRQITKGRIGWHLD